MEEGNKKPVHPVPVQWAHEAADFHGLIKELDHLAMVAADDLEADEFFIGVIQDGVLYAIGAYPLPGPSFREREYVPGETICARTIETSTMIDVVDARQDPVLCNLKRVRAHKVVGYLGVPVVNHDNETIGAISTISHTPRHWLPFEQKYLQQIARNVDSILFHGRNDLEIATLTNELGEMDRIISALSSKGPIPISIYKPDGELVFVNAKLLEHASIDFVSAFWRRRSVQVNSAPLPNDTYDVDVIPSEPQSIRVLVPTTKIAFNVSSSVSKSGLIVCTWFNGPKPLSQVVEEPQNSDA
ncbi:GAF domain-containing protein [Rhodobacteraceae bacterium]|nr:GAF domain-containing protein [Paracoccaceae bacterium]